MPLDGAMPLTAPFDKPGWLPILGFRHVAEPHGLMMPVAALWDPG